METKHHVIAKSRGGSYDKDNMFLVERIPHDHIHSLFGNNLPLEIIRSILSRYQRTLDPQVHREISETLRRFEFIMEAYNKNCYNSHVLKNTI